MLWCVSSKIALLTVYFSTVFSHAILYAPIPRLGRDRLGLAAARYLHANNGTAGEYPMNEVFRNTCGTADRGPGDVRRQYRTGDLIEFTWKMTEAHIGAPEYIRLAVKYSDDDDFNQNVLFEVDSVDTPDISGSRYPGECREAGACGTITKVAEAPLLKPCTKCTLQWIWDSQPDRGGYIDCVDISITGNEIEPPKEGPTPAPIFEPTNLECREFCNNITRICLEEYVSIGACVENCESHKRTLLDGANRGDTYECRRYWLGEATKAKALDKDVSSMCKRAGAKGGDACIAKEPCEVFCRTFKETTCQPNGYIFPEYDSLQGCIDTCKKFPTSALVGPQTGNSLQCREYYLGKAYFNVENEPRELLCSYAQKSPTRMCTETDRCETFCQTFDRHCGGVENITMYTNCTSQCADFKPNGEDPSRGNTLQCREYHLSLAILGKGEKGYNEMHCPDAALEGGDKCVEYIGNSAASTVWPVLTISSVAAAFFL